MPQEDVAHTTQASNAPVRISLEVRGRPLGSSASAAPSPKRHHEGKHVSQTDHHAATVTPRTLRDRIGLSIGDRDPPALVRLIEEAEAAGVEQVWMGQGPVSQDTLTVYAVALGRTEWIRLGISVVPTYPRNVSSPLRQVFVRFREQVLGLRVKRTWPLTA